MNPQIFISFGLILLFEGAIKCASPEMTKCYQTKDCPDSGTVCKMAGSDAAVLQNDPAAFTEDVTLNVADLSAAFDPPVSADDERTFNDEPMDDEASDDSSGAKVAEAIDNNYLKLKPGVNVAVGDPAVAEDDAVISSGTILLINGWRCAVTNVNAPGKSASADALARYRGSANDPQNTPTQDSENATSLQTGKRVILGAITCKVVGQPNPNSKSKSKPSVSPNILGISDTAKSGGSVASPTTTRSKASSATNPPPLSTTARSSAATTKASTVTTRTSAATTTVSTTSTTESFEVWNAPSTTSTEKSSVSSLTKSGKPVAGRCVCDADKRFACTTDEDCGLRFRSNVTIQCFKTFRCPTELGIGYCRMVPDHLVLQDVAE